ncbi:MAG: hypothetical protein AAF487_03935 [Bacteroidota bacterium]
MKSFDLSVEYNAINPSSKCIIERYELSKENLEFRARKHNDEFIEKLIQGIVDFENLKAEEFESYELNDVLDYLERTHKYYKEVRFQKIEQSLLSFSRKSDNALLNHILFNYFEKFKYELNEHIIEEESTLFPFARFIENQAIKSASDIAFHLNCPIDVKLPFKTHDDVEFQLDSLIDLLMTYEPSLGYMLSFKILLCQLKEFNRDLKLHELIEEEVLIPKLMQKRNALQKELDLLYESLY